MKLILNLIKKIMLLFKKTNKKSVININKSTDGRVVSSYNDWIVGLNNILE